MFKVALSKAPACSSVNGGDLGGGGGLGVDGGAGGLGCFFVFSGEGGRPKTLRRWRADIWSRANRKKMPPDVRRRSPCLVIMPLAASISTVRWKSASTASIPIIAATERISQILGSFNSVAITRMRGMSTG